MVVSCSILHLVLMSATVLLQVEKKRKRKAQEKDGKAKKQKDFKF